MTVVIPVEVDIPDEIVRRAIDAILATYEPRRQKIVYLNRVMIYAEQNGVDLPDAWMMHPDVKGSFFDPIDTRAHRRHWGDFVV